MNFSSFILFSIERNMITNKFGLEIFYSAFKDSCGEDFDKKNKPKILDNKKFYHALI